MNMLLSKIKNLSLIHKLIISYLFIIFLPVFFFYLLFYNQSLEKTKNEYRHILQGQILQVKNNTTDKINQLVLTSKSISNNSLLKKYLQYYSDSPENYFLSMLGDLGSFINSINEINPYIYFMRIYTTNKDIPRYRDILFDEGVVQDEKWFPYVKNLNYDEFVWDTVHPFVELNYPDFAFTKPANQNTGTEVFTLYKKIYSVDNYSVLGYLEINVKKDVLLDVAQLDNNNIHMFILDQNLSPVFETANSEYLRIPFQNLPLKNSADTLDININNEKYMILYDNIEGLNLKILLAYPYKKLISETNSRSFLFIMLAAVSIFVVFFITTFVSKAIFKRMNVLTKHMKEIQKGNFDVQIEIDYMDEVGQIKKAFNVMADKTKNLINTVYKAKLAEKEATLSYLQSQMNPHFLFNTLEAIRMMADITGDIKVSDALFSLSKILKTRIKSNAFISLSDEVDVIKSFINIENIRFNDKVTLDLQIDSAMEQIRIPALILQPIIENSIAHGFRYRKRDCIITLRGSISEENDIILEVIDNGQGISSGDLKNIMEVIRGTAPAEDAGSNGNGIGLYNVNERIKLYYGDRYGLQLTSVQGTGTRAVLRLSPAYGNT